MNTFTVSIIQAQEENGSIVDTSTTYYAIRYGYMRKGFYAEGLFWAFYNNGTIAGWEFSNDGTTWTGDFTSIGTCNNGRDFTVWFDGTYIQYARLNDYDLFYRHGTPVNDGTITWSAVEQTVYDGNIGDEYKNPCICVDTNGYAWIGALNDQLDGDDFPVVLKNSENDGTWATEVGFDPYELSAVDSLSWKVCPVPLTDGKVYVIYNRDSQLPLGNLWNGTAWVGEENDLTDYNINGGYRFSAVALGNNVHFIYNRKVPYQIRYNERVYGAGWNENDVLIQDAVTDYTGPVLSIDTTTGDLYCVWTQSDHVYYKKYSADAWGDLVDWIDESTDGISYGFLCTSWYQSYGNKIGLLYVTKTASPYNIKFAYLEFEKTRLFTLIETTILSDEFSSTVEGVLLFVQFTDLLVLSDVFYSVIPTPPINYAMIALLAAVAAIAIAICGIDFERKKK